MKTAVLVAALSLAVPSLSSAAPHRAGRTASARAEGHAARVRDPLHLQLARAVFPRERWERLVSQASLELTQRLTAASQGQFRLDPEFSDRLREEYERLAPYEELVANQSQILGRQYTPAELRQLLAFYRTPLGKKSVLLIHDLTVYSDRQMQQKVHAGMSDALDRLKPLVHAVPGAGEERAPSGGAEESSPPAPDLSAADGEAREL
jgi:hypothetical protein